MSIYYEYFNKFSIKYRKKKNLKNETNRKTNFGMTNKQTDKLTHRMNNWMLSVKPLI